MSNRFPCFLLVLVAFCMGNVFAADPVLDRNGIKISLKGVDDLVFSYPKLQGDSEGELAKIYEKNISPDRKTAVIKYEGGTELHFTEKGGGLIEFSFKNIPTGLKSYRMEVLVPFAMNEGGRYSCGDSDPKAFPMEKPEKPFLYQGNARSFRFTAPNGENISLGGLADGTFIQLQDNREWGWAIYCLWFQSPYNPDHASVSLKFSSGKDGDFTVDKMVDKFGQDFVRKFPGKIGSIEELKNDTKNENKFYSKFQVPKNLDQYGGFEGTCEKFKLKKTGFFNVRKVKIENREQWFLVDPDGNMFFHRGICCFGPGDDYTYTQGREDIFEWLPPREGEFATAWNPDQWWNDKAVSFYLVNVIRKYEKPFERNDWAGRMIDRVRALGFTSGGAFSAIPDSFQKKKFPYVCSFGFYELGHDIPGARGFFDPFEPELAKKIDGIFERDILPRANDPLLIGYYLANEQGAEDLPRAIPALNGNFATKKELVSFIEKRYGTIGKFNSAWKMDAKTFVELLDKGLPVTTKAASEDVSAFTEIFLDRYYSLLAETFRKYDKNHMLIGSRWQPGTANNEMLVRICAKYNDIISVNYYTMAYDSDFLDRIYKYSGGKPILLSEWHYASTGDSGQPSSHGVVNSQKERGLAYRNYVEHAAASGYVVGIEWFTLIDQARAGRFFELNTGEKSNTGIFSVADRPWTDFVNEAAKTNHDIESVILHKRTPFKFDDPRFSPKSQGKGKQALGAIWLEKPLKIDGSRDDWPGTPPYMIGENRMVMGTDSNGTSASFRAAWDEEKFYVFLDVNDKTPGMNDLKGADLWQGDGVELFFGTDELDKPGGLIFSDRQVLIGAGKGDSKDQTYVRNAPLGLNAEIERAVLLKPDGSGYYIEAAIPFAVLDWKPKAGEEILFDIAIDDSEDGNSRARQFVWNGDDKVSNDRSGWGRVRLIK